MSDTDHFLPGLAVGAAIAFGVTVMIGAALMVDKENNHKQETQELRAEAVKRHAAEWVVDPATGSTTFKWREVTEQP